MKIISAEEKNNENVFFDRSGRKKSKPKDSPIHKRESVYGILIEKGKIFLVKPTWKSTYDLPGGGIEPDETDCIALKREFLEETGYDIELSSDKPFFMKRCNFYADDIDKYFDSTQKFYVVKMKFSSDEREMKRRCFNTQEIRENGFYELDDKIDINKTHKEAIRKSKE